MPQCYNPLASIRGEALGRLRHPAASAPQDDPHHGGYLAVAWVLPMTMTKVLRNIVFLSSCGLALCWTASGAAAEQALVIDGSVDSYSVAAYSDILEDPTGTLTIDDIRSPEVAASFRQSARDPIGFGYTDSTYWVRFTVTTSLGNAR